MKRKPNFCGFKRNHSITSYLLLPTSYLSIKIQYQKRTVFRMTFRRIVVYTEHGLSETEVFMRFGFPHHHGRWPPIMEADT